MKPIEFQQANVVYAKDQPEYLPLPALKVPNDPQGLVITKWELSPEELERLKETGTIYLSMLTFNQPLMPVMLTIDFPAEQIKQTKMKNYIGIKQVKAEPCTLGEFIAKTGRNPYQNDGKMHGNDEPGYLVEYKDGYQSWSPKEVFEEAYYEGGIENASDGYHTFKELYDYRLLYNASFANLYAEKYPHKVVKSYRHHDGELCFGGGWFIVMIELPTGQISNHYENKDWDLFKCIEVENAPEWDGHTPKEASDRLYNYLKSESI